MDGERCRDRMTRPPSGSIAVCGIIEDSHLGAQTVRRGGVGPVRSLLGSKPHRPLFWTSRYERGGSFAMGVARVPVPPTLTAISEKESVVDVKGLSPQLWLGAACASARDR